MNLRVCSRFIRDYTKYTGKLSPRKRPREESRSELSPPAKKAAVVLPEKGAVVPPASNGASLTLSSDDVLNVSKNATSDKDGYYHFHVSIHTQPNNGKGNHKCVTLYMG